MATRYVVIGGGVAATSSIEGIREIDQSGEVVLITAERELPYSRPPLSKSFLTGREQAEALRVHEPAWYRANGVRVRIGQVARSVHQKKQSVTLESGEREPYDRLLLATGSRARRITVPGVEVPGVAHLRTATDGCQLRSLLKPGARVVCVGGGFLGVEVAATARAVGAEVTLLESGPSVFRAFADATLSLFFQRLLESRGVVVRPNHRVTRFRPGADGRLSAVAVDGGEQFQADVAVVGVGAEPNTEWLATSGFGIDRGGVVVNVRLETQGPNVWAAGDIARFPDPTSHQPRRLEHWDNALRQGKQAGRNMAGAGESYLHPSRFTAELFDVLVTALGDTEHADSVQIQGSMDEKTPHLTAHYIRARKLVGAVLANLASEDRTAEIDALQRHIVEGTAPEM